MDQEAEVHTRVGRNWASILEFSKSFGYKLNEIQFVHEDGNTVSISFKQLQTDAGISLLRSLMVGGRATVVVKTPKCTRCNDEGYIMIVEDCHQSAGTVPCPDCQTYRGHQT